MVSSSKILKQYELYLLEFYIAAKPANMMILHAIKTFMINKIWINHRNIFFQGKYSKLILVQDDNYNVILLQSEPLNSFSDKNMTNRSL